MLHFGSFSDYFVPKLAALHSGWWDTSWSYVTTLFA